MDEVFFPLIVKPMSAEFATSELLYPQNQFRKYCHCFKMSSDQRMHKTAFIDKNESSFGLAMALA
jgi:hypothetical protein